MFWGCTLKQGSNVKYTESALFHLSNICLVSQGKANVVAQIGGKDFSIALLESAKLENRQVDLYFNAKQVRNLKRGGHDFIREYCFIYLGRDFLG